MQLDNEKYFQSTLKVILLIICFFSFESNILSQAAGKEIDVKFSGKYLNIGKTPFNHVVVLDNRIDSGKFYNFETGLYPINYLYFGNPRDSAFCNYFKIAFNHLETGPKALLINIQQLRITNKKYILRRNPIDGAINKYNQRQYISFKAETFSLESSGRYKKIVAIDFQYYSLNLINSIESMISVLFNKVIEASSDVDHFSSHSMSNTKKQFRYLSDTLRYTYFRDTTSYSIEEINKNQTDNWDKFPIFGGSNGTQGVYQTFDDFRNNNLTPAKLSFQFSPTDSFYTLSYDTNSINSAFENSWVATDGKDLYVQLLKNTYLKLKREGNLFYFYLPKHLPNIYSLLVIEDNNWLISPKKMLLSDFTMPMIKDIIKGFIKESRDIANDKSDKNRIGYLDMDTGDFIY